MQTVVVILYNLAAAMNSYKMAAPMEKTRKSEICNFVGFRPYLGYLFFYIMIGQVEFIYSIHFDLLCASQNHPKLTFLQTRLQREFAHHFQSLHLGDGWQENATVAAVNQYVSLHGGCHCPWIWTTIIVGIFTRVIIKARRLTACGSSSSSLIIG